MVVLSTTLAFEAKAEQMPIQNSGIVIVNDYIQILLSRIGLIQNREFVDKYSQVKCVQVLSYTVTGSEILNDQGMELLKVMCGLPPRGAHYAYPLLEESEKRLISSLLEAMISHWPAIGNTSVDGLRGNFLIRAGSLQEVETSWNLTVERRAYDVLLTRSPFSFSVIKYPWMSKVLYVTWPN